MGNFEKGRWLTIDPKLKSWYEDDIILIDSLLEHTTYDPQRERPMNERKRRVELIGNSDRFKQHCRNGGIMDIKQASVKELLEEILSRGEDVAIEPFPYTRHYNEDTCFAVMLNETIGMEFNYPARIIGIYTDNEKYEPLSNP